MGTRSDVLMGERVYRKYPWVAKVGGGRWGHRHVIGPSIVPPIATWTAKGSYTPMTQSNRRSTNQKKEFKKRNKIQKLQSKDLKEGHYWLIICLRKNNKKQKTKTTTPHTWPTSVRACVLFPVCWAYRPRPPYWSHVMLPPPSFLPTLFFYFFWLIWYTSWLRPLGIGVIAFEPCPIPHIKSRSPVGPLQQLPSTNYSAAIHPTL